MYRISLQVFSAYVIFSITYFILCSWLVQVHYPERNVIGSLKRMFFWIDGYAIYFSTVFVTSLAGMVLSRMKAWNKCFWGFLAVFMLAGAVVMYAAMNG